jgi:hypothetical protein
MNYKNDIILMQEICFTNYNNLLSNCLIDREKTTITGAHPMKSQNGDTNTPQISHYEDYIVNKGYLPGPTFFASFTEEKKKDLIERKRWYWEDAETTKSPHECQQLVLRAMMHKFTEWTPLYDHNMHSFGPEANMIYCSTICSSASSFLSIYQNMLIEAVKHDQTLGISQASRVIERLMEPDMHGIIHQSAYKGTELWIDIDDLFLNNNMDKLITVIDQHLNIQHRDDFIHDVIRLMEKQMKPQSLKFIDEIYSANKQEVDDCVGKLNQAIDKMPACLVNSNTIDNYIR